MEVPGSAFTKRPAPPELLGRSFCYGCACSTWDNQSKMCAKFRTLPSGGALLFCLQLELKNKSRKNKPHKFVRIKYENLCGIFSGCQEIT